jgi:excisionase family DNA binding protein
VTDELLTVAEVAERLKLNPQTIYNWINAGSLPHTKVGRGFRVRVADIETLTDSKDVDAADADLLTVAEVAEMLKLSQQTVRNWIDAGKLPALRMGRRVRIKRQAIREILEAGASGSIPRRLTASDFWGGEPLGEPVPSRALRG